MPRRPNLVTIALVCTIASVLTTSTPQGGLGTEPRWPPELRGLLNETSHNNNNPCEDVATVDYVSPFVCVAHLSVLVVQWLPQFSLSWVMENANPSTLFGIVFLLSTNGVVIPEKIAEFENLVALHLASVAAPLSAALLQLTKLQVFDINEVKGGPIGMPLYDHMPELQAISLANVEGGTMGPWPTFVNLTKLTSVSFRNAGIRERPPQSLFLLPSLTTLDLSGNPMFNGPLPENITTSIVHLFLDNTNAEGTVLTVFARLLRLQRLVLNSNRLHGPIPPEFGALTKLDTLLLHNNEFTGSISSWIGELTQLVFLDLSDNLLDGTLPAEIASLTALQELNLAHNAFHGPLPAEWAQLSALTQLRINSNHLTGGVFCFPALVLVDCSDNYLTGKPPAACRRVWTENCDFSGLSDPEHCEQRANECDPWAKQYSVFGEGCVHLVHLVALPAAAVFVIVLGVFLRSFGKRQGWKTFAWSFVASVIAALEFSSSWTTVLAMYFDVPFPFGPVACCVFVLVAVLHGVAGCFMCPAKSDLRGPAVLVVLLARQLLVEMPWRAVFARKSRKPQGDNPIPGFEDGAGQGSQVAVPPPPPRLNSGQDMLQFTRRAAFVQVVVNTAVLGCQATILYWYKASHVAGLAFVLGFLCLVVSLLLYARHWWNERKWQRRQ